MTNSKGAANKPLFLTNKTNKDKFIGFIKLIAQKIKIGNININSKAVVYYGLLSFFPLISLLGSIIPLLHLNAHTIMGYLPMLFPKNIDVQIEPVVMRILTKQSNGLLSFGIIGTIWTSSGVTNILKRSINDIYGIDNNNAYTKGSAINYVIIRIVSIFVTFIFVSSVVGLMFLFILGQQFLTWLLPIMGSDLSILSTFTRWKWPVTLIVLMVIIALAYALLPNRDEKMRYVWPGTIFSALGFAALAQGFSLYLRYFGHSWDSYGTIGAFFILIIWFNLIAMIFMIGAAINAAFIEGWKGQRIHKPSLRAIARFKKKAL